MLTGMAACVWWLSTLVPGMDYPQFLVFVRALQDVGDPASPFHGTYAVAAWYLPTSLPIQLTSVLSHVLGHSLELAGKVLFTAQTLGVVAASLYFLHVLGRPRWAILLLFPLIHSQWTVVGGFIAFATSLPITILGWALTVRWLSRGDRSSGLALAACLTCAELWHGIGFTQVGFGFAVLWALWRAPSWRARAVSVLPTVPSLALFGVWMSSTFGDKSVRTPPYWTPRWDAVEDIAHFVEPSVPHYKGRLLVLVAIVGVGLLLSGRNVHASGAYSRTWRVRNVGLVLSLAYLAAYLVLPVNVYKVEAVGVRFAYPAALAMVFAWNPPSQRAARGLVLGALLAFSAWGLVDVMGRFRAFAADTRGASALIDRLGPHDTLYYCPAGQGESRDFAGPTNKPMRELEQYATVRKGGLPNSSFAGYGVNYIRYAGNVNPMPGLSGPPSWSQAMTKFDWVLTRSSETLTDRRFLHVESNDGWELYGVCGSKRFPACP